MFFIASDSFKVSTSEIAFNQEITIAIASVFVVAVVTLIVVAPTAKKSLSSSDDDLVCSRTANGKVQRWMSRNTDYGRTNLDARRPQALRAVAAPGMKRRRSSQSNTNLEGSLPAFADALYEAIERKDSNAIKSLCADDAVGASVGSWAEKAAAAAPTVGTKHVSSRTATVHVDVTIGGVSAVHKLSFDEDGLITSSDVFTLAK